MAIVIDFETYSPVPIDAGSYKYMAHPDADIICMAYKVNDERTRIWLPGQQLPEEFVTDDQIYAHNALFDYLAWHIIGHEKYGFPEIGLKFWIDTQALANRYSLPGGLAKVGNVLGVEVQKSKTGTALIKKISCPLGDGSRPILGIDFSYDDFEDYQTYCELDVDSTYYLVKALPANTLAPLEQKYWELTQRMNMQGLPVDVDSADKILSYIEGYVEEMTRRVPEITDGKVTKITQVKRVVDYLGSRGIEVSNLQAATVEALLTTDLPDDVKELLELRQAIGRSSTAKYRKIKEMEIHGRVYNNLHYYGTSTGRWAGRGFQLHNLPRASVKRPEEFIERFNNFEPVDDPVNIAKALIRPMIKAEEGTSLIVSDYKSIENRLLAWVARDENALELFRTGEDQYKDMASFMYRKNVSMVTDQERQIGKIIILGCGYGMGAKRFVETAKTWGVHLSQSEALVAVNSYRDRYSLVKKLWYKLKDCAVSAIQYPGRTYEYNDCTFRVVKCRSNNRWLVLGLPSGRNLFYMDPYLSEDTYGLVPGHYGTNPYTKKWDRLKLIPGRITENVIQALARDIMANGLLQIQKHMPEVTLIGTVHDEAIGEIDKLHIQDTTVTTIDVFNRHLCHIPEWAEGLPLEAEGWIGRRYKK